MFFCQLIFFFIQIINFPIFPKDAMEISWHSYGCYSVYDSAFIWAKDSLWIFCLTNLHLIFSESDGGSVLPWSPSCLSPSSSGFCICWNSAHLKFTQWKIKYCFIKYTQLRCSLWFSKHQYKNQNQQVLNTSVMPNCWSPRPLAKNIAATTLNVPQISITK